MTLSFVSAVPRKLPIWGQGGRMVGKKRDGLGKHKVTVHGESGHRWVSYGERRKGSTSEQKPGGTQLGRTQVDTWPHPNTHCLRTALGRTSSRGRYFRTRAPACPLTHNSSEGPFCLTAKLAQGPLGAFIYLRTNYLSAQPWPTESRRQRVN